LPEARELVQRRDRHVFSVVTVTFKFSNDSELFRYTLFALTLFALGNLPLGVIKAASA